MFRTITLSAFTFLTFFSCNCQKTVCQDGDSVMPQTSSKAVNSTYPKQKVGKNTVRLCEKQNIFLKDHQMNITFKRTVDDSRCPMNARCIWAGNASVEVELMTTTSRPQTYKLSVGDLRDGLVNRVDFGGYKVTLEQLYPSNSTDMPFSKLKGKYVIDLKVEPITN